jgi:hypothetical protein
MQVYVLPDDLLPTKTLTELYITGVEGSISDIFESETFLTLDLI